MKREMLFLFLIGVLALSGCAAIKQAVADKQLSDQTPMVNGEVAPATKAQEIGNTVASLPVPFAVPIGVAVTFIAGWIFSVQRGTQIRKNGGVPVVTTSNVGLWTGLVQDVANAFAGAFTVASTTSPSTAASVWQRIWKGLLATATTGIVAVVADPSVTTYLTAHPVLAGVLGVVPSLVLGIEKLFSSVPAVVAPAPAPAAA